MKLIVGLGNPEEKFNNTRHNIGFDVLLSSNLEWKTFKDGLICKTKIDNEDVIFLMPQTYMNSSGISVKQVKEFFKIDNKDIIIIYDEMALPLGKVRISNKGSHAGHNGIKSIIENIGEDFIRYRIGIDHPGCREKVISHVLGKFNDNEFDTKSKIINFTKENYKNLIVEKYDNIMNNVPKIEDVK